MERFSDQGSSRSCISHSRLCEVILSVLSILNHVLIVLTLIDEIYVVVEISKFAVSCHRGKKTPNYYFIKIHSKQVGSHVASKDPKETYL